MGNLKQCAVATVLLIAGSAAVAQTCDSQCLRHQLDSYLDALLQHDPTKLAVASDVRCTENGQVKRLGEGLWEHASSISANGHYFVDPVSEQALFIGVMHEGTTPAIVSLRLGISNGKIAEVEHVVALKGSHALFAPDAYDKPNPTIDAPVAKADRLSRDQLIAIANSYMEGIQQHSSRIIKAAPNCQRIENGIQTTGLPGRGSRNCQASADLLTYIKSVDDRRFPIADPKRGIVVATFTFNIPGEQSAKNDANIAADPKIAARLRQSRTLLLSEIFKIDHGAIQHIEAVMHNLPHGAKSGWSSRR